MNDENKECFDIVISQTGLWKAEMEEIFREWDMETYGGSYVREQKRNGEHCRVQGCKWSLRRERKRNWKGIKTKDKS